MLDELRLFLSISEQRSFAATARSLSMARSTLRRRMEQLEGRVGVPLFHRSSEGIILTEAGADLSIKGRRILQEASALLASYRDCDKEPTGLIRVVLPVGLPPQMLALLFALIRRKYPRLSCSLRFDDDPARGLLEDVDIAVHFGLDVPEGPWQVTELIRVREWLIASPEYLSQNGTPESIEDLKSHELLAWRAPGEAPCQWPTLDGASFEVEPRLICTDIHLLRQCARNGLGIALVPDALLPEEGLFPGSITALLTERVGRLRPLRLLVPNVLSETPRISVVVSELRTLLRAPGPAS